jgi:hypothetical protein
MILFKVLTKKCISEVSYDFPQIRLCSSEQYHKAGEEFRTHIISVTGDATK